MSDEYDLLLEWVSERGAGTWDQFRAGWDFLHRDAALGDTARRAWEAAAGLSALAHLEVSWADGTWAAAPPVLTMLPRSGGRALLTGARTRWLFRSGHQPVGKLVEEADELGLWPDAIESDLAPSSVYVACESAAEVEQLAERCGIAFSYCVSDQLAEMLPSLAAAQRLWTPGGIPEGFDVERYDPATLLWKPVDRDDAQERSGLYRSKVFRADVYVLVRDKATSFRVPREYGVYEVLRWAGRSVIAYDSGKRELWVPSWARLPLQHERAAVLSSGRLPTYRRGSGDIPGHYYINIAPEVAERIRSSLHQLEE